MASQTAIYGLSSTLARALNFALTPLHTDVLAKEEFGKATDIYAMIAFLMVILTFGMETAYFRFSKDKDLSDKDVFNASSSWVLGSGVLAILLVFIFLDPIAELLQYSANPEYIIWMIIIVAIDALAAVPFAKLRADNKPLKFVLIRFSTTGTMVVLNLVFYWLFPYFHENGIGESWLGYIYNPNAGAAYMLIANLIGNLVMLLLFAPDLLRIRLNFKKSLLKKLLIYALPLVIAGLPGIANEMANRQFLKFLLPEGENFTALGIFGANVKIATFMMLFIQAFRFAAEPFFFSGEGEFKDKMARVMHYFVLVQSLIFLGLVCFLDLIKKTHFIDEKYWEGLDIVPILVFANLLLGINFNLNIWYKLKNLTRMGVYITSVGFVFTIISNFILIPKFGYIGAAWATLISYASMTAASFYLNQKYDYTKYPLKKIGFHLATVLILAYISFYIFHSQLLISSLCFLSYLLILWFTEAKTIIKSFKT